MKIVKKIAVGLLIVLIALQFFQPEKNQTEDADYVALFETETKAPKELKEVLKTACYDCHSDNTVYPWYANIAPVSYWLDEHIEHGKEELNFSDWANYSAKKKDHKLDEVVEEVEEGKMPLDEYTWTHTEARLTAAQKKMLMDWANAARAQYQVALQQD